jgi:hypothetical protein
LGFELKQRHLQDLQKFAAWLQLHQFGYRELDIRILPALCIGLHQWAL